MIPVLLLSATLGCAAWLYGGTEPWAWRTCQGLAVLCLSGTLVEVRRRRELDPDSVPCLWQWRWGLPFLLLAAFMMAQAANPSHVYSPGDEGLSPLRHVAWLPRSVSRLVTLEAAARLATCAMVMACARCAGASRRGSQVTLGILCASGAAMAVQVILQRAESPTPPFGVRHHVTGMFANSSNYAAYANLLLPVALSLGRAAQARAQARGYRSHPGPLLYMAAAVLMVSVFVSGSRAGAAIALVLALAWLALEWVQGRGYGLPARGAAVVALPLALAAALYMGLRADRLGRVAMPFADGLSGMGGRVAALRGTVAMFADRWVAGTGSGTFACAFPYYQPPSIGGLYFRYAHNDWLEYPSELGVIGAVLLAWLVAAVLWPGAGDPGGGGGEEDARRAAGGRKRRRSSWRRCERRGIGLALAGLAAHALVDFPFHIPATLLTAAALAGLLNRRELRGP